MNQAWWSVLACSQALLRVSLTILLQEGPSCLKTHSYKTSLLQVRYKEFVLDSCCHTLPQASFVRGWKANDYICQTSLKLGFWKQARLFEWEVREWYLEDWRGLSPFSLGSKVRRVRGYCMDQTPPCFVQLPARWILGGSGGPSPLSVSKILDEYVVPWVCPGHGATEICNRLCFFVVLVAFVFVTLRPSKLFRVLLLFN